MHPFQGIQIKTEGEGGVGIKKKVSKNMLLEFDLIYT